jgi:hypothetical protein
MEITTSNLSFITKELTVFFLCGKMELHLNLPYFITIQKKKKLDKLNKNT